MVDRYVMTEYPHETCMDHDDAGPYVLYEDYAALQAENERLKAAHDDTLKAMRQAVVALAYAQQNDPIYLQPYGLLDAALNQAKGVHP